MNQVRPSPPIGQEQQQQEARVVDFSFFSTKTPISGTLLLRVI